MIINTHIDFERAMRDEFRYVEFFPNLKSKHTPLSKRKPLKALSEVERFTPLHILILDNLSYLLSIIYYHEDNTFILALNNGGSIYTEAEEKAFIQIINASTITEEGNK